MEEQEESGFFYWLWVIPGGILIVIILIVAFFTGYLERYSNFLNELCECGGTFKPWSTKFAICNNCGRRDDEPRRN